MDMETFLDNKIFFYFYLTLDENVFSFSQVFCHLDSISLKLYLSTKLIINKYDQIF